MDVPQRNNEELILIIPMNLKNRFKNSQVPNWCSDLDETHLKIAWENDGSIYLLDTQSPFALEKGFFSNSKHIFRFKYVSSGGGIYYYFAIEDKVMHFNEHTFKAESVPGLQILKTVSIKDDELHSIQWQDDVLPFQSNNDPMYAVAQMAKKNALKSAPNYLKYID